MECSGFWMVIKLCIVFFIIIYFFPRIKILLPKYEENVTQFIFVLAMTFLGGRNDGVYWYGRIAWSFPNRTCAK